MNRDIPEPKVANLTLRIVLSTISDVMGQRGLHLILARAGQLQYKQAIPPADFQFTVGCGVISRIYHEIEMLYGPRGARGFMARAGSRYITYVLQALPDVYGSMRQHINPTLPPRDRLQQAVEIVAASANEVSEIKTITEIAADAIYWKMPFSFDAWGRKAAAPICWSARASTHALLVWLTDNPAISITEVACHACGDPYCSFQITCPPD